MRVSRFDRGALRPPKRLPNGCLRVDAVLTRSGVFPYQNPDGTTRLEYRPPDEVFDDESRDSFAMVPVTNDHPPVMITADNSREFARGTVGENVRRDGNDMVASLMITDAALVRDMESGKREVSNGYHCDLDMTPGTTPEGERYDAIQRNIRGNHVAIVDKGRAGNARVRMDASENSAFQISVLDNCNMDLAQALEKLGAEKARADVAEALLKSARDDAARLEGERDAARADADAAKTAAEKVRTDAADALAARVRERVALEAHAARVLGEGDRSASTDREIKAAVIAKVDGFTVTEAHCDTYVSARFDAAVSRADAPKPEPPIARVDSSAGGNTEAAKRREMEARNAALGK